MNTSTNLNLVLFYENLLKSDIKDNAWELRLLIMLHNNLKNESQSLKDLWTRYFSELL